MKLLANSQIPKNFVMELGLHNNNISCSGHIRLYIRIGPFGSNILNKRPTK